jgi:DNA-binding PadR family transcriptional regulator
VIFKKNSASLGFVQESAELNKRSTDSSLEKINDAILVEEGALYPSLHRLAAKGLISAEWGFSENNRKARYYELTREGRRELRTQESVWQRYVIAVSKVLQPVAEG